MIIEWLQRCEAAGDFVMDVDGYYVYWPDRDNLGALDAVGLRALADHLDNKNKVWDDHIQEEFSK